MIWIDFSLLFYSSFRVCGAWCEWASKWEKLALAFLFALALKSLFLFFLIRLSIKPNMYIQISVSILALILSLLFPVKTSVKEVPSGQEKLTWLAILAVGGLFILSMINAWFFPITESDAIWYHIRGMSFFNEVRFDSDSVVSQLKQYPPFIPLLFVYLIAFKVEFLKVIFPLLYLCLNIIFYSRVLSLTENKKIAYLFTMVLATTPYFWWHGVLPFLDLTTAVFYSTGILYWYFWMKIETESISINRNFSYALVSGLLLGLAAWTRIEFLLYDLVPIFLTIYIFSRFKVENWSSKSLAIFFPSLLLFPSIWFFNLYTFEISIFNQFKIMGGICTLLWVISLSLTLGKWKISQNFVLMALVVSIVTYLFILLMFGIGPVPVWKKLAISLYRISTIQTFYLFTSFLVIFLFFENLKNLSEIKKYLGYFLILFLLMHIAIFTYSNPKWPTLNRFFQATLIQPGDSVNLSDARGMMSVYPVFIFFISSLPFIKKRLENG